MNIRYANVAKYQDTDFPGILTLAIVSICVSPFILIMSGVDLGHAQPHPHLNEWAVAPPDVQNGAKFTNSIGILTHTILEWGGFIVAIFTAILAFTHYNVTDNPVTPIIAAALFCTGCIDAFGILTDMHLVAATSGHHNATPFAWAISRIFNALILMVGVSILSVFGHHTRSIPSVVILSTLTLLILAYGVIHVIYPSNPISQHWSVLPLAMFLFCGIVLFPLYYNEYPSVFAYSLIIAMVPNVIAELHMVFGATQLFDDHFNAAHFLKIIAYAVPVLGLVIAAARTYKNKELYQQKFMEAELQSTAILQTVHDGIVTIDDKGQILMLNPAAEQIFGYSQDELIGRNMTILTPAPEQQSIGYLKQYLDTGKKKMIGSIGQEILALRKDGTIFPIDISVGKMFTQHKHTFTAIIRDITERKAAEKLLQQQMQELKRSNQELDQFAYIASHDLQEPLRMVSSYMQLLESRYKDQLDENAREFIGYAVDGAKRMQLLIQELLKFSRLNTRAQEFDSVNANDLYHYALDNLAMAVDESDTTITKEQLPSIYGHTGQLRQLFQNLIGNAVKYRDPKKHNKVHVSVEQSEGMWQFCIEDNGIGIQSAYYEKIFIIFKRLHITSEYPGTGIGLAICKKIVENHGGRIWVESEYGQGTWFYFTIPVID